MTNDEWRMDVRSRAAPWLRTLFCCLLFASVFLISSASRAEADKDMGSLIGSLEDVIGTNKLDRVSTNEASLLAPPLPEIPPTLWERFGWVVWLVLPFVVMLAAIIAAICLRARKPPVLVAPAAQARVALTALQPRPEDGAALSQISQILRRYLIAAFWLPPGESTTAEFCATLMKNGQVGPEVAGAVSEFLKRCDERKFSPEAGTVVFASAGRALELVDMAENHRAKRQRAGALQDAAAPARPSNA